MLHAVVAKAIMISNSWTPPVKISTPSKRNLWRDTSRRRTKSSTSCSMKKNPFKSLIIKPLSPILITQNLHKGQSLWSRLCLLRVRFHHLHPLLLLVTLLHITKIHVIFHKALKFIGVPSRTATTKKIASKRHHSWLGNPRWRRNNIVWSLYTNRNSVTSSCNKSRLKNVLSRSTCREKKRRTSEKTI